MYKDIFNEIGLTEYAHNIYFYLLEHGTSSARQVAENLAIPRPSIYDNLKELIKKGLVVERDQGNRKVFQIDDIKNLSKLIGTKIEFLEKEKSKVSATLPSLLKHTPSIEPRIKFYSGAEGVRQVLNDVLWHENIQTYSMWPISEMIDVLGPEYLTKHNQQRIRQHIHIKAIWPRDKVVDLKTYPFMGVGKGFEREVRLAPRGISWRMGFWLYADKVAFLSSHEETFGFVIHSRDFAHLLATLFKVLWSISKPVKPQPAQTNHFLKTI